jgi:hypothetical protein
MPPSQSTTILSSRLRGFVCRSCFLSLQKPQRPLPQWLSRTAHHGAKKARVPKHKGNKQIPSSKPSDPEPVIRHFEQTPDGRRVELPDKDPAAESLQETIGSIIGNLDEELDRAAESLGISRKEFEERIGVTQEQMEQKIGMRMGSNPWEKQDGPDEEDLPENILEGHEITEEDIQEELQAREIEAHPEVVLPEEIFAGEELSDEDFRARMSEDERRHSDGQLALISGMQRQMDAFPDVDSLSEYERLELRRMLLDDLEKEENEDIREYPDDEVLDLDDPRFREGLLQPQDSSCLCRLTPDVDLLEEEEESASPNSPPEPEKRFFPRLTQFFRKEQGDLDQKQLELGPPTTLPAVQEPVVGFPSSNPVILPHNHKIPTNMFPNVYQQRLSTLNNTLSRAYKCLGEKVISETIQRDAWRSYMLCRKVLLEVPELIPSGVWYLLWEIFERPTEKNVGRMEHIFQLGKDMKGLGLPLQDRLPLFIESASMSGENELALEEWHAVDRTLDTDEFTFRNHWEVGVRMYCRMGQPGKAMHALSTLMSQSESVGDYRLLIPIIRAYLAPETPIGFKKAWALYRHLKFRLGDLMTMEDYDSTISLFLEAGKPDRALRIFVDMMRRAKTDKAAQIEGDEHDALDLAGIANMRISVMHSQALANLPAEYTNKFFFGKWIKKLIGDGDLSGAKRVLDHMRDRGIRADSKHMNGLIGAWYRTKSGKNQALADEAAQQMIAARIEFVRERQNPVGSEGLAPKIRVEKYPTKHNYRSIYPLMPRATIETFSILIEHYRKRRRDDLLGKLFNDLREAKVRPSTFFMNEMILSHAQSKKASTAWKDYLLLTNVHSVHPDFATFEALWLLERRASDPVTRNSYQGFGTCRELFYEMIKHFEHLTHKETMTRDLYESTILGFAFADDHPGLAVALRALQHLFNMYPNEQTARTIVLHLTRVGLKNEAGFRPRRLNIKASTKDRIKQVTEVLTAFKQRRTKVLLEQGIVFEEMDNQSKVEEALLLMTNLLRYITQARLVNNENIGYSSAEEGSMIAARNMGVPECNPWIPERYES